MTPCRHPIMVDRRYCCWGGRHDEAGSVQGVFPRRRGNEPLWPRPLLFHMSLRKKTKRGAHIAKTGILPRSFCSSATTNALHLLKSGCCSHHVWKLLSWRPADFSVLTCPSPSFSDRTRVDLLPSFLKLSPLVFCDSTHVYSFSRCLFLFSLLDLDVWASTLFSFSL